MAQVPIKDLAKAVATAAASLTLGTNAFPGPVRPAGDGIPQLVVFFVPGAVTPPIRTARGAQLSPTNVDIRLRGKRGDYDGAYALALELHAVARFMDVSAGGDLDEYTDVKAVNAAPAQLGQDDQEHWMFNIPVRMDYVEF